MFQSLISTKDVAASAPEDFVVEKFGVVPISRNITIANGIVSFEPLPSLSPHYVVHCCHPVVLSQGEQIEAVCDYTADDGYCTEVNLALAADHLPSLEKNGPFIAKLNDAIVNLGQHLSGVVYRGVELSDHELQKMLSMGTFFLPSFTSTSLDNAVAQSGDFEKNTLLIFDVSDAFGLPITDEMSIFEEEEVLLASYTQVQLTNHAIVSGRNIVNLKVLPRVKWCGIWEVTLDRTRGSEKVVVHLDGQSLVSSKLDGNMHVLAGQRHWELRDTMNPPLGSVHSGRVKFRSPGGLSEFWFPDNAPQNHANLGAAYTLEFRDENTIVNQKGVIYRRVQ